MNSKNFATSETPRVRCPVCHQAVFSRAGIHPQCAVRLAEPPRPKVVKEEPVLAEAAPADKALARPAAPVGKAPARPATPRVKV